MKKEKLVTANVVFNTDLMTDVKKLDSYARELFDRTDGFSFTLKRAKEALRKQADEEDFVVYDAMDVYLTIIYNIDDAILLFKVEKNDSGFGTLTTYKDVDNYAEWFDDSWVIKY